MSAESKGWCAACQNTGWLTCHCGGDLCICENNGEYPCPYCESVNCDYDDAGGFEDLQRLTEADNTSPIFRDHSCWRCNDGAKPCVRGGPHRCEYPRAHND